MVVRYKWTRILWLRQWKTPGVPWIASHSLDNGHPSLCLVKRMVVMYCETVLRLCGIRPPALRYGASSYISMGMLAYLGSSSIWCLSIFTSALLHGGIPMCFQWKKRMLVICLRGQSHVWAASWRFLLFPCLSTVSILFVSATKVQRIREICKRIKEKWCYPPWNSTNIIIIESTT